MKRACGLLLTTLLTIAFRRGVGFSRALASNPWNRVTSRSGSLVLRIGGYQQRTSVRLLAVRRAGVDPAYYSELKRESERKRNMATSKKKSLSELEASDEVTLETEVVEGEKEADSPSPAKKKAKTSPAKEKKEKSPAKPKAKAASKEGKVSQADYMPKSYPAEDYAPAPDGHHKVVSYNVNGLKACYDKGFVEYVKAENPDFLVLQETKLQKKFVADWKPKMEDLGFVHQSWSCSVKPGYAGTAVLSKVAPHRTIYGLLDEGSSSKDEGAHNEEGRTITTEFDNFFLVNCYVPNSGMKLERLEYRETVWDPAMLTHLKTLEGLGKPVVFTGDLNVAAGPMDLLNDKKNYNKTAGYCQKEIDGFKRFMDSGFIDAFRHLNPEVEAYTYWGMRFNSYAKNSGWRIDYFVCSEEITPRIEGTHIRKQVYGASDHVPIILHLKE